MAVHRDRYMHQMWLDGPCKIYRPCNVQEVRRRRDGILRSRQGRQHSRFLGCADVISWGFAALAVVAGILIPWERRLLNNLAGRIASIYMGWPADAPTDAPPDAAGAWASKETSHVPVGPSNDAGDSSASSGSWRHDQTGVHLADGTVRSLTSFGSTETGRSVHQ